MRALIIFALGLACLLGTSSCNKSGTSGSSGKTVSDEWQWIRSTHGGFSIQMPGIPIRATNSNVRNGFTVNEYSMTTEIGPTIAYAVSYFDLPNQRNDLSDDEFFDAVLAALASKGKVLNERPITVAGNRGRECEMELFNGQAHIQVRLFLVNNRVFILGVVMPNQFFITPKNPDSPKRARALMDHFFDSMNIKSN